MDCGEANAFDDEPIFPEEELGIRRRLDFLARPFPPLQREMRRSLHLLFRDEQRRSGFEAAWFVARMGREQFYEDIVDAEDPDDIPALISEPGLGGIARQAFVERWMSTDVFERRPQTFARREFAEGGFADPTGLFQVYGAGCWVILVDTPRLGGRPVPRTWEDLLHPRWQGDIVSNGQDGIVVPLLLFNLRKDYGLDAVHALARNVRECRGGAAMARFAGTDDPKGAAIYILPHFWAGNVIRRDKVEMVWPREGAYAAPLIHLKKRAATPAADLAHAFITGRAWARWMESTSCASVRDDVPARPLPGPLRWVGWEYARSHDVHRARGALIAEFMKERAA